MTGRILLLPPGEAAARAAVDWAAAHLGNCRVVAGGRPDAARPIGRLAHPPFAAAVAETAALATRVAALLCRAPEGGEAEPAAAGAAAGENALPTPVIEAAALAVVDAAPLLVSGSAPFRELTRFSAWSMNVQSRPTDAVVERHAAIAARAPGAILTALATAQPPAAGAGLADAFARKDARSLAAAIRTRRLAARADGPIRFRRVAAKSAGLRPFALYLDLVPALVARSSAAQALFEEIGPEKTVQVLGMSIAIFF